MSKAPRSRVWPCQGGLTWAELEQAQASTMRTLAEIGSSASTSIDVRENCVTVYASDEEALRTKLTASGASLPDAVCVVAVGPMHKHRRSTCL